MDSFEPETAWSAPETDVLQTIDRSLEDGGGVLATIVSVDGNAYRRPGAKMVVSDEGAGVGSITAGCLESEVREVARAVDGDGQQRLERFDLTGDGDVWGLGLGCNGVIDVLFEPLREDHGRVVDAIRDGTDVVRVTVLASDDDGLETGDRVTVLGRNPEEAIDPDWPPWVETRLEDPLEALVESGSSETVTIERDEETVSVFVDVVTAPSSLVVFGADHDVGPVTELARLVDFDVTVVSFRGGNADETLFPAANRVRSMSPASVDEELELDDDTYAVLMTHNAVDDRLAVEALLDTPVPYIGLMGPTERFETILEALEEDGEGPSEEALDRLYTPVGLDLGGGTPYQIALSVVSEVQAVANDREPGHLRERTAPIHERVDLPSS